MAKRKKSGGNRRSAYAGGVRSKNYGGKARSGGNNRKVSRAPRPQSIKIVVETVQARDNSPLTASQALAKPAPAPRARQF